jgi:HK97 family phage major capsid protein
MNTKLLKAELEFIESELRKLENEHGGLGGIPEDKRSLVSAWLRRAEDIEDLLAEPDADEIAKRNAVLPGYGGTYQTRPRRNTGPFKTMGEQVQAIIKAGTPGAEVDPRLYKVRAATGLSESVGADGGFLLQPEFSYDLIKGAFDTGLLVDKVTKFTIGENKNSIQLPAIDETSRGTGSRWGGIQLYHVAEADEKTKSKPKFRRLELNLKKLVGVCYVTDELIWDVPALEQYLRQGFAEEYGYMLDDMILTGTGAGQGLGLKNSGSLVTQSTETGQSSGTIIWENVQKMFSRLIPKCRKNAIWCIGIDGEKELWNMALAVGTGGVPVYQPANGAADKPYSTLFGRPVYPMEQMSALGSLFDICVFDPSWVVMADKSMKTDISIHVRFLYDEQILRIVYRYDLQPILASAITPASGGDSLSSHVTLAAR